MNTAGNTWEDSTADSGANVADGLRISAHVRQWADLQIQGILIRVAGNTGPLSYPSGEDAYGIDANIKIGAGARLGGYYVANSIQQSGSAPFTGPAPLGVLYHLYGPGGGAQGPATPNCPVGPAGIQCPAAGSGAGAYVMWDIVRGIHLDGEAAQWTDAVHGTADYGWQANISWILGDLLGTGHDLILETGYLHYGANFYPPYGAAEADIHMQDALYPGNVRAFTAMLSFNPVPQWTIYGNLVTGSNVSNGQAVSEHEAGVRYELAPATEITLLLRNLIINGVQQLELYRAELNYAF